MPLDSEVEEAWENILNGAKEVRSRMKALGEPTATEALTASARAAFSNWPEPYNFRLAVTFFGQNKAREVYLSWVMDKGLPQDEVMERFDRAYPRNL